jgi:excisionase family DNA binding protein
MQIENPFEQIADRLSRIEFALIQLKENATKPQQFPELHTVGSLSKLLNLSIPTIYGLTHRNSIPYIKKGKRLYFRHSEIMNWLEKDRLNV